MSVKELVDRGLQLRSEISERQIEMERIEEELKKRGLAQSSELEDLKDADREGRRWFAAGTEKIVPVIFTADKIFGSFKSNGATHEIICAALGRRREKLLEFYRPETTWGILFKDGKKFRTVAGDVLGSSAPAFITACVARDKFGVARSDIKIEWDEAEKIQMEREP
ncbi:MAG TPA: hypothetical protein VH255_06005 [Verrucomicrobiae bacterium]|jgi:hypothetical protein|nr:hypothetical protein [Verrucomicrobiae bacterium]